MALTFKKTHTGIIFTQDSDCYGISFGVQETVHHGRPALRIGQTLYFNDGDGTQALIDQSMARDLIAVLQAFVTHGNLKQANTASPQSQSHIGELIISQEFTGHRHYDSDQMVTADNPPGYKATVTFHWSGEEPPSDVKALIARCPNYTMQLGRGTIVTGRYPECRF